MMTSNKKKPNKPKIKRPRLKWVLARNGFEWVPYHRVTYTDATGKRKEKTVKLNWGRDPKKLDEEFWAAEAGRHPAQQKPDSQTWKECIQEWRADARIQKALSPGTKKSYNREFEKILARNGQKPMAKTTRGAIRRKHISMAETPRAADWMLQAVSILWNYAKKELEWKLGENPASGMRKYGPQRELPTWPDWMLDALVDAPQDVQIACMLIKGTGQRPSAAIKMPVSAFQGEWVEVTDEKGGQTFPIYCPEALRKLVEGLPTGLRHVLAKTANSPLSYSAVEKAFSAWRATLGERAEQNDDDAKKYSLHGLRKRACVELAEAGCSDAEIQAITGQSLEMVAKYRKEANRKRMSRVAQQRRSA